jgi:hypothetical protein
MGSSYPLAKQSQLNVLLTRDDRGEPLSGSENLELINHRLRQIEQTCQRLDDVLIQGNGHSVVSRLVVLEEKMLDIRASATQIRIALTGAALSVILNIGLLLFQIYLKSKG